MKTYTKNQPAPYGFHFSAWPPDICFVGSEGEALDGRHGGRYAHVPTLLVLALGPVLGGAFVLMFPMLVLVSLGVAAAGFIATRARVVASEHAYLARVGWEPATAYLNKKNAGTEEVGATPDEKLEKLADEVKARREGERKS